MVGFALPCMSNSSSGSIPYKWFIYNAPLLQWHCGTVDIYALRNDSDIQHSHTNLEDSQSQTSPQHNTKATHLRTNKCSAECTPLVAWQLEVAKDTRHVMYWFPSVQFNHCPRHHPRISTGLPGHMGSGTLRLQQLSAKQLILIKYMLIKSLLCSLPCLS